VDPVIGALISGASNVIGGAVRTTPAGPSSVYSDYRNDSSLNNWGWTVATGAGRADARNSNQRSTDPGQIAGAFGSLLPLAIVGAIAFVLVRK